MMTLKQLSVITLLSLFVQVTASQAQIWKKVQRKLEDKANQKVDDVLNGKKSSGTNQSAVGGAKESRPYVEEVYSFTPGTKIIFESDFKFDTKGLMPKKWKSSGSGSILSVADMPGKWLALAEQSTYKIDSLINNPGNFTVEFDILTRSAETADIGAMSFGFARDNASKNLLIDAHNGNAITNTQLHFHNQEVINSSSDTDKYNTLDYPFASYSNSLLHVAITVEGENMRVYIDKAKVLDTKMFKPAATKFFYITAPYSYEQGSKVYFGNFVMAK
ncbi:hypothetical protein IWX76_000702 [Pedobacter sp. CAN_A7]|uniref:hypothetical protein n=1 Tax=Pedobacter sp. CAN_A7 TaxID=2787722 RepID=UPI001A1E25F3